MGALLAIAGFVGMEAVVYLSHRFLMHGPGMPIHASHHRRDGRVGGRPTGLERNDLYPAIGAVVTMTALFAGLKVGSLGWLVPLASGVTTYGVSYFFVHDVYIHRRLRWFTAEVAVLERLKTAHRAHHLWGGEPYGMLFPVVPTELALRAAAVDYDPFPPARPASGSRPSQVPAEP